mmetsp:Transcript_16141/g.34987  ORF Transcript_16141/g.34987 Transcript_16141/m.34987 type:complete len:231 (+) Transcript_16141:282-974(+)
MAWKNPPKVLQWRVGPNSGFNIFTPRETCILMITRLRSETLKLVLMGLVTVKEIHWTTGSSCACRIHPCGSVLPQSHFDMSPLVVFCKQTNRARLDRQFPDKLRSAPSRRNLETRNGKRMKESILSSEIKFSSSINHASTALSCISCNGTARVSAVSSARASNNQLTSRAIWESRTTAVQCRASPNGTTSASCALSWPRSELFVIKTSRSGLIWSRAVRTLRAASPVFWS